jgi:hypothetical protein
MIGIVFYLAGSLFFNLLANHLTKDEVARYWPYSYVFDMIKNLFFAIAIILFAKQNKKRLTKISIPFLDIDQIIKNH